MTLMKRAYRLVLVLLAVLSLAGCASVKDIKDSNKKEYEGTREDLIAQGYEPCGRCHP